jgi:hypothetical protein
MDLNFLNNWTIPLAVNLLLVCLRYWPSNNKSKLVVIFNKSLKNDFIKKFSTDKSLKPTLHVCVWVMIDVKMKIVWLKSITSYMQSTT